MAPSRQQLGILLENKVFQKLKLSKNVNNTQSNSYFNLKLLGSILVDLAKDLVKSKQTELMNNEEKLNLNPHLIEFIRLSVSQHFVQKGVVHPKCWVISSCSR